MMKNWFQWWILNIQNTKKNTKNGTLSQSEIQIITMFNNIITNPTPTVMGRRSGRGGGVRGLLPGSKANPLPDPGALASNSLALTTYIILIF